ncbi:hypothetical protein V2B37_10545 [Natranaerobius thermophilus JW/NM-WN-LF]
MSIAVEGKASESFGITVGEWMKNSKEDGSSKATRLNYLKSKLG